MQALIRSKSAGITGGRGTAGAGPGRDLLCHSYGLASHQVLHDLALSCTISHKK